MFLKMNKLRFPKPNFQEERANKVVQSKIDKFKSQDLPCTDENMIFLDKNINDCLRSLQKQHKISIGERVIFLSQFYFNLKFLYEGKLK